MINLPQTDYPTIIASKSSTGQEIVALRQDIIPEEVYNPASHLGIPPLVVVSRCSYVGKYIPRMLLVLAEKSL
jgi:hypothetical protein